MGLLKYSKPFSLQNWIDIEVFYGAPIAKYHVMGAILAKSCYILFLVLYF